jgi:acetyl esterase
MTREETLEHAKMIRNRDRFGILNPDETAKYAGNERELHISLENGQKVHLFEIRPSSPLRDKTPMIINFHGGGFIKGRTGRDLRYCSYLAEHLNCLIWDLDYRLAPEEPFPAAVDECFGIIKYAFTHAEELGVDPRRIALAGHSSGGNLAASACIKAAENKDFHACALLLEYFPADLSRDPMEKLTSEQLSDEIAVARAKTERLYNAFYCTEEEQSNPLASPLLAPLEALTTFPASLVISAKIDSLCQETEAFAHRLAEAGVCVTQRRFLNSMHGFTTNRMAEWEEALKLHCRFFNEYLY